MFREDVEPLRSRCGPPSRPAARRCAQLGAGDRLVFGESTVMTVLHPPPAGVPGSDNAQSIVLAVECHGRRVLLPGDLETPGTQALLAQPPWDCDVLLAPHHGSARSNPPGFSAWCQSGVGRDQRQPASDKTGGIAGAYQSGRRPRLPHGPRRRRAVRAVSADGISAARWQKGDWEPCGP